MENQLIQKPCLVNTAQGFSVSYNNRLLYSKYAPSRALLAKISSLNLLPGTIILALSPVLEYGLKELEQILPENCIILACEIDANLFDFEQEYKASNKNIFEGLSKTVFLTPNELYDLPFILNKKSYTTKNGKILKAAGVYKRILPIEMSAGANFHLDFYNELIKASTNSLMTYWSNRITLTKFGRLYSKNYFTNLKNLQNSTPIQIYFSAVGKPIIVFGAGESFEDGIAFLKANNQNNFFIIAVDTAIQPLLQHHIHVDGVFIEEAQFIISKAFLGALNQDFQIFAGLSSIPQISRFYPKKNISYFRTLYTQDSFIDNERVNNFLPPQNNPFGSVGLTAVYYSLKFRKDDSMPVFICGLDFSYSAGKTHTKGAMAHIQRIFSSTKTTPVENYNAAFNTNAIKLTENTKNNSTVFTTPSMLNYANMFIANFSKEKNLFDLGKTGINLMLPDYKKTIEGFANKASNLKKMPFEESQINLLQNYLDEELAALEELRDLLTGKIKLGKSDLKNRITALAEPREYLYLHFPDGNKFSTDLSFLKRIRSQLDYFIKVLK